MHITNINEAKTQLSHLIKLAMAGEEVIIARANEPQVRLQPIYRDTRPRQGGQWAGKVTIHEDFEFTDSEIDEFLGSASGDA